MNNFNLVLQLLEKHGPLAAGDLQKHLSSKKLSNVAARQRISRARGGVQRFRTISLPKREQFLFITKQSETERFWKALLNAHTSRRSAYGVALQSILARGGIIPLKHFEIVSGSPFKLRKHLGSETLLDRLVRSKMLRLNHHLDLGDCISIDAMGYLGKPDVNALRQRLVVEEVLLTGVLDWARKIGFVSYKAAKKRRLDHIATFGQFGWDITGPSYIRPLSTYARGTVHPGFLVADVAYCELDENQILYFFQKCNITRAIRTMRPFLPLLVAERFTNEAFKLGKKLGIVLTTPEILFGRSVAESLKALAATLQNAAKVAEENPERVAELLNSLSAIEGAVINLRGALFELIVGHLVLKGEGSTIDIGVTVTDSEGKSAEIDVRRVKGDHEVALYECKGLQPQTEVSLFDVEKWLTKKVPTIRSALLRETRFRNTNYIFEYWTSGRFSDEAVERLEMAKRETLKYAVAWRDGASVLQYAKEKRVGSIADVLREHFTQHPLS
ncbi:MAG TPA: hypothetical protein VJP89_10765 [Pyrinomonadaceae bacterium]|nr:hypothetical protein [Pyrinomonadaceae bacterium]